jgi:hypothetical protein
MVHDPSQLRRSALAILPLNQPQRQTLQVRPSARLLNRKRGDLQLRSIRTGRQVLSCISCTNSSEAVEGPVDLGMLVWTCVKMFPGLRVEIHNDNNIHLFYEFSLPREESSES